MMRSLFSGVSGLKIHQTKMDVIGNNIANVNTIGFKSSSANFADTYYQTLQNATGPNAATGAAGTNAMQIGLGGNLASITTNVTGVGGTQRTDRGLDLMINGNAFFIVQSAGETYFSRAGAMNVDPAGNLYCTTNGATVMGWLADANGDINRDTVSALKVRTPEQMYSPPQATTYVTLGGNIDKMGKDVAYDPDKDGYTLSVSFYDRLGTLHSAKLGIMQTEDDKNQYTVKLLDILDSNNQSILKTATEDPPGSGIIKYDTSGQYISFGGLTDFSDYKVNPDTGEISFEEADIDFPLLVFNAASGNFESVGGAGGQRLNLTLRDSEDADTTDAFPTAGIEIDFSSLTMYTGETNIEPKRGDADGNRGGYAAGSMTGFYIDTSGKIFGTYSNGLERCFGQIALATFPNPSGLESVGNSLFKATLNSGEFDGIGVDPSSVGGLSPGALEMSNVDLASEFTSMITTQRGFQSNSRIITTSDSMLEELLSLKR